MVVVQKTTGLIGGYVKSFLKTLFILFCLGGWALAAATLHVVRTPDGTIGIIPKNHLSLYDTYVDVRAWTAKDLTGHEELLKRLQAADKLHWIKHLVPEGYSPSVWISDFLSSGNPAASQPAGRVKAASKPTVRHPSTTH